MWTVIEWWVGTALAIGSLAFLATISVDVVQEIKRRRATK